MLNNKYLLVTWHDKNYHARDCFDFTVLPTVHLLTCSWSTSSSPVIIILFSILVSEYPPFTVCNTFYANSPHLTVFRLKGLAAPPHFVNVSWCYFIIGKHCITCLRFQGLFCSNFSTLVTWVVAEVTFSVTRMGDPAASLPRLPTCTWESRTVGSIKTHKQIITDLISYFEIPRYPVMLIHAWFLLVGLNLVLTGDTLCRVE